MSAPQSPTVPAPRDAAPSELPTSELVKRLTDQVRTLVTDEVALARSEMTTKAKAMGVGAGLAAVIVGVVLLVIAGVLALVGKNRLKAGSPPVPQQAIDSTKRDVETVKAEVSNR